MESIPQKWNLNDKKITGFLKQMSGEGEGKLHKLFGKEILLGRNPKAHIIIQNLNVSRKHCSFCYTDKGWTVIDKFSCSGVYVGQVHLVPDRPFLLKDGDRIYLGPPYAFPVSFLYHANKTERQSDSSSSENKKEVEQENRHKQAAQTVESAISHKDISFGRSIDGTQSATPKRKKTNIINNPQNNKRRKLSQDNLNQNHLISERESSMPSTSKHVKSEYNDKKGIDFKGEKASNSNVQTSGMVTTGTSSPNLKDCLIAIGQRLAESAKLEAKVHKTLIESEAYLNESKSDDTNSFKQVGDISSDASESMLPSNEDVLINHMDPYPFSQELNSCVINYKPQQFFILNQDNQTSTSNEVSFKTKSFSQKSEFEHKQNNFSMKSNLNEVKELKAKLLKLEEELNAKNMLQIKLEKELETHLLKQQKLSKNEAPEKSEEISSQNISKEVASQLTEIMEAEFACGICTEIFIKGTTLDCSHTFCESCISTWRKRKKQCPICRHRIKHETKPLVIDNFIEKMISKLNPEFQERRAKLIKERLNAEKPVKKKTLKRSRRSTRSSHTYTEILQDTFENASYSNDYLLQLSASDSDSSLEGYGYYGGYGRCYNCGRRGHWANGCPEM